MPWKWYGWISLILYCHRILFHIFNCPIIILFKCFNLLSLVPNLLLNYIWVFNCYQMISCSGPFFLLVGYIQFFLGAFKFLFPPVVWYKYLIYFTNFQKWNGLSNGFWKEGIGLSTCFWILLKIFESI